MTTDRADREPPHACSPTAHIVETLELHGFHPIAGEPDPREMPEPLTIHGALADVFDALVSTFTDTPLERDLEQLLWSQVHVFHRMAEKAQRDLDDNEDAQKRSQREQDGSEVKSVELERLLVEGQDRIDRRDTYEATRSNENAPSHRVFVGQIEIGAAWAKRSNEDRAYLGLKLDDPSFTAPIYANLFDDEGGETYSLIWSRPNGKRNGD